MLTLVKLLTLSVSLLFSSLQAPPAQPAVTSFEGLVPIKTLKALPSSAKTKDVRGYPGSKLHYGAFTSKKQWDAFDKAWASNTKIKVNWSKQVIAFVVLDAQTNAFDNVKLTRKKKTGVVSFDWSGIEPFYADATPAVLIVVDKKGLDKLEFRHAKVIGSVNL